MLDYILSKIKAGEYIELIPVHPEAPQSRNSYISLFFRFEKYFDGREKRTKFPIMLGYMAVDWMKGKPYPQIIKEMQSYRPKMSIPTLVREVMDIIENTLRFKCVEYTRCYIDLIAYAFSECGLVDKIGSIPSIPLYLEIGASSGTMVNLVGLGFSRTTAGLLNETAANHAMDRSECIKWLLKEPWEGADLPRVCLREINGVLGNT